ncbi:MAG: hypothetical protein NTU66_03000 [Elusimicrobia bacterium]|nr:hypothetical protein [Elusimicrobiota bacterium]
MSKIWANVSILVSIILFIPSFSLARIVMNVGDEMEVVGGCGVFQLGQSSGACTVDATVPVICYSTKTIDNISMETDALDDYGFAAVLPQFLTWMHDRYFVNVHDEGSIAFKVQYQDEYNNPPSEGYPKLTYWKEGTQDRHDIVLDSDNGSFGKRQSIPLGQYSYQYTVKNNYLNDEYSLEVSSFVVTNRPAAAINPGVADNQTVVSGKVHLAWDAGAGIVHYKAYLGTDSSILSLVYEGADPACDVTSLVPGQLYYWQIETINEFGVASKSSILRFTTLGTIAKSYNYPNPFNPARGETTKIVFMMDENGSAEISVYSESGDSIRRQQVDGLCKGSNEIAFDGRDEAGNQLYNGSYVCSITKKYSGRETRDRCRLLVIK